MLESDLYEPTERFATKRLGCWTTKIKTGFRDLGEVDVLGVRYLGGDLSGQSEVIAIEVKSSTSRFAVSAGQAHGYSVAADRCYLAAVTDGFTPTQVLIAGRLGIGLIRIWQMPSGQTRFEEVLTAPANAPIDELRFQLVDRLGLANCALCQTLFSRGVEGPDDYKNVVRASKPGRLGPAAERERGLMWWLHEQADAVGAVRESGITYLRRFLCPACVRALAPS